MGWKNTDNQPIVSVVIPTYNRRSLLLRAVDSALQQTVENIEVIIADDGSTDGTQELFQGDKDQRIRYCWLPHRGACAARNAGIDLARGQYIALLDSDDVWRKEKLAMQKKQLEESGADVVCCAFLRHDLSNGGTVRYPGAEEPEGTIHYQRLLGGNLVSTQTIFGRSACIKQVRFDEQFPRMQDWEYAIRLAKEYELRYFPDVLVDLYVQPDSISRKPALGLQAVRLLYSKYQRDLETSMPNTLLMLNTIETFAEQCGEYCAQDYLKAMSIRRSLKGNGHLLIYGSLLAMKEALRRLKILRRGQP